MKASRAILLLALASIAVTVLATDPAPADVAAEVQKKSRDHKYSADKGYDHHNHHHKYGSYGDEPEGKASDKTRVINLKVVSYDGGKLVYGRVGNVTAQDAEKGKPTFNEWGGNIACGTRRSSNEKGDRSTESTKSTESPSINWNIQDTDIIGRLKLKTQNAILGVNGWRFGGRPSDNEVKPVMIGNSPAWQIGVMKGGIDFDGGRWREEARRDRPGGAATCDPLLDGAYLSFWRREIPVFAMITKAAIPADPTLLRTDGPGLRQTPAHTIATTDSGESLQTKIFGSASCGVALVAMGDVKLYTEGGRQRFGGQEDREQYKGTMQTTLAWNNILFTLPGGFSTGHPFFGPSGRHNPTHAEGPVIPVPQASPLVQFLEHVVDGVQLWAMCNDAVPTSTPGEITLSLKPDEREKWDGKLDEERDV